MANIGYEDIETIVSRCSTPSAKIVDYKVEPFSKSRPGIMGNYYSLSIDLVDDIPRTLTFFVKALQLQNSVVDESVFLEEVNFYNLIYPHMKLDKWSPDCYLAKPGILVLEDLCSQGYALRSNSIFDECTLKSSLATLARFHSASIVAEKRLGKPLNRAHPEAFREKIFTNVGKGGRSNKLGFQTLELLARRFGLDGAEVPKVLERLYNLVKPIPGGGCNTLCHGDLWRGNLMFKDDDDDCLLVDFQMLRYASPTLDVAMLLYVHADKEMRVRLEYRMIEHYYKILQETLVRERVEVPNFQTILESYNERRIVGMAYSALRWPVQVMSQLNDIKTLESWYFNSRIEIYTSILDEDPDYEMRMKAYMEELIGESKRISNQQLNPSDL